MIDVTRIEPSDLPTWWERIAPFVSLACEQSSGRFRPEHIVHAVIARHFVLWVAHREREALAMMLARFQAYPTGLRTLELLACTGEDRFAWQTYMPEIQAWARSHGAGMVEALARTGWDRILKPYGFRRTHVLLECPLTAAD